MDKQLLAYLPLVIVLLVLIRRTQRPKVIRPGRLWIAPAVLLVVAGLYTVGAVVQGPPIHPTDIAIILATALGGILLGALRAHFVHLSRHPDTGDIEAKLSAWGLAIVLLWIGGRFALRQSGLVTATAPFGLYMDAVMALAVGAVMAQAVVLTRRIGALVRQV